MFPDVVRIEPSSACTLRCIHCPTGRRETPKGIMSQDTFDTIISQLPEVPRVVVMYHGGEPTLNKNVWSWILQLKKSGVQYIKMNTNGTLMDRFINKVIFSGLDEICFSIDGNSEEENDSIRIGSRCQDVIGNIKLLIEAKRGLGIETPNITINNIRFNGNTHVPEFLFNHFGNDVTYKVNQPIRDWYSGGTIPPAEIKGHCPFIDETITIRWNGDVIPCCYDITSKCVMGNIHRESLTDIWDNGNYKKVREGIANHKPVELCQSCVGGI